MYLKCICGYIVHDIVFPGKIEHLLLSSHAQEKLQDQRNDADGKAKVMPIWLRAFGKLGNVPYNFKLVVA